MVSRSPADPRSAVERACTRWPRAQGGKGEEGVAAVGVITYHLGGTENDVWIKGSEWFGKENLLRLEIAHGLFDLSSLLFARRLDPPSDAVDATLRTLLILPTFREIIRVRRHHGTRH